MPVQQHSAIESPAPPAPPPPPRPTAKGCAAKGTSLGGAEPRRQASAVKNVPLPTAWCDDDVCVIGREVHQADGAALRVATLIFNEVLRPKADVLEPPREVARVRDDSCSI